MGRVQSSLYWMLAAFLYGIINAGPVSAILGIISFTALETARNKWKAPGMRATATGVFIATTYPVAYTVIGAAWIVAFSQHRREVTKMKNRKGTHIAVVEHSKPLIPPEVQEHVLFTTLGGTFLDLMGASMKMEYIGNPEILEIRDQFTASVEIENVINDSSKSWQGTTLVAVAACSIVCAALGVERGIVIAALIALITYLCIINEGKGKNAIRGTYLGNNETIPQPDGVYRLYREPFGYPTGVGIGYLKKGISYTRYHVTGGSAIEVLDGVLMKPSYINKHSDNVAYGGVPQYGAISDGEEVIVALVGQRTRAIVMYKSVARVTEDGLVMFPGDASTEGCSGSPIFKEVTTEYVDERGDTELRIERVLVGTIGWYLGRDARAGRPNEGRVGTEMFSKEAAAADVGHASIAKGEVRQVFKHPGAGKTYIDIPYYIWEGLRLYGRVIVTGPNKTVSREDYKAITNMVKEGSLRCSLSLCISGATEQERGMRQAANVIVGAHPTMLHMLNTGTPSVSNPALWIVDEAHFKDARSITLRRSLPNLAKTGRVALVELTATGWNIRSKTFEIMEGSRFPIEDQVRSEQAMIQDIPTTPPGVKRIVFATSVDGREATSIKSLANKLRSEGIEHTTLHRKVFNTNFDIAKKMKSGCVLASDISECGANIEADEVYDFQRALKGVILENGHVVITRPDSPMSYSFIRNPGS